MKTKTTWKTGHAFESFQKQGKIEVDGATGFGPKALLLTGLAACSGIDVVDILEKMRVPFAALTIDAEGEQTTELPKTFKRIMLTYRIEAEAATRGKIKKAIDLSLEKYCGVAAMLQKSARINYEIDITPIS